MKPLMGDRFLRGSISRKCGKQHTRSCFRYTAGQNHRNSPQYNYSGLYQYLLNRGIAILAPNIRGSSGFGISYQKLIHRDWGGGELKDIEHAAKYLQAQAWVDNDKIGVFGRVIWWLCNLERCDPLARLLGGWRRRCWPRKSRDLHKICASPLATFHEKLGGRPGRRL